MTGTKTTKKLFESGMVEFANARYDKSIELFTRAIEDDRRNARLRRFADLFTSGLRTEVARLEALT